MTLKYDLHTHILPAVDDGAKNAEESLLLINALRKQGVLNVCLTPHFYTHKESMEDFLERRNAAYRELLPLLPDDMNFKLGAEVYVTKYIFSEERDITALCIEGTPYMITEFSYDSAFSGETMRLLTQLRNLGIVPVLPHVERYPNLLKSKSLLEELIYMGVIIQSNTVSYTESLKKRKLANLIKSGHIHVLSTDVHNMNRNSPESISEALEFIKKKCLASSVDKLNSNAKDVFEGL